MQSGQVSIWVPVVVAVLGIAGALISGWLARRGAREDAKEQWKRETAREEERWKRELEKLALERQQRREQRAHEARLEWRIQRLDVYKTFLAVCDEPNVKVTLALHLRGAEEVSGNSELRLEAWERFKRLSVAHASVEILASVPVRNIADKIDVLVERQFRDLFLIQFEGVTHPIKPEKWEAKRTGFLDSDMALKDLRQEFLDAAKVELELETSADTSDVVNPSQPSAPTS